MRPLLTRIALLLTLLLAVRSASALNVFETMVPNGTVLGCTMCHGATGPPLKPFGSAFTRNNHAWNATLAAMDSDGDGFSNGVELGDPLGAWLRGDPNPAGTPTNPSDPASHPAPPPTPPTITQQPVNQTVLEGSPATFTVVAAGTAPLSYQWLSGVTPITGANAATFTIAHATPADAGSYSVTVGNTAGSVTSTAAQLSVTVLPPSIAPTITQQPASQTVLEGNPATFTVVATGTAPLSYQWLNGTTPITGANAATFTIAHATPANAGDYSVTISNLVAGVSSTIAHLTVTSTPPPPDTAPSITRQPASQTVLEGASVTFTVGVSGTAPFSYQWVKGTTLINGATSESLTLARVTTADAGSYSVTAVNSVGSATSHAADLVVTTTPPPPTPLTIALTSPARGASYPAPASFALSAAVTPDGAAKQVRLLQGRTVVATFTAPPYSTDIKGLRAGEYSYQAEATDAAGKVYLSSRVSILVTNVVTPPPVTGKATVSVTSPDPTASEENLDPGTFRISRTGGDVNASLVVYFSLGGSAKNGQDYQLLPESVTLPAGQLFADITVVPIADNDSPENGRDTVKLELDEAPDGATPYRLGEKHQAVVTISEPVTPPANQLPTGRILRPTDGARFPVNSTIPIVAFASDSDGTVASVEFFVGDTSIGLGQQIRREDEGDSNRVPGGLYVFNWSRVRSGTYAITAKITDNSGAVTTTRPVTVTVSLRSR